MNLSARHTEWPFWKLSPSTPDAEVLKIKPAESVVHFGIGGSGLGPKMLAQFLGQEDRYMVIDHLDFDRVLNKLKSRPVKAMVGVSKSGSTAETMLAVQTFIEHFPSTPRYCISDPGVKPLPDFFPVENRLTMPAGLGGRYCLFSSVGQLPLQLMGHCPSELLSFSREAATDLGLELADFVHQHRRPQIVVWAYGENLSLFPFWFSQLWGESVGKEGKGIMPIPAQGPRDQHSLLQMFADGPDDKVYLFVGSKPSSSLGNSAGEALKSAMLQGTRDALKQKGRPVIHWEIDPTLQNLGKLAFASMVATAQTADLWQINAFDQPGVELAKTLARAALQKK